MSQNFNAPPPDEPPIPLFLDRENDDFILFCCDTCDEEYHLPEGSTQCPVCGDEIEPCQ